MMEKLKRILCSKTVLSFLVSFVALYFIHKNIKDSVSWLIVDTFAFGLAWFLGKRTKEAQWKYDLFIAILLDLSAIALMSFIILKNFLLFMEGKTQGTGIELTWLVIVFHCFYIMLPSFSDALDRYYEIKKGKAPSQINNGAYRPPVSPATTTNIPEEDDITPILAIAEGTCDFLAQKGLEHFLLKDYVASGFFFSNWDFLDKEETQNKLYVEMRDMLSFLELPQFIRIIVEYNSENNGQAGSYQKNDSYDRIIKVNIKPFYSRYHVFAILCHECTHYFMEYHKLNWNDTELNEQKTDVIANLIGFNNIMLKGYREISIKKDDNTTTHKIGYITDQDCMDLSKFIKKRRQQIMKNEAKKKSLLNLRLDIEKSIEVAKTLALHLTIIDLTKLKAETPEQFAEIQKIIMDMETHDISVEIKKYEEFLTKKMNLEQLLKTRDALERLCTKLVTWQAILQGH